jgi:hypothetical protein
VTVKNHDTVAGRRTPLLPLLALAGALCGCNPALIKVQAPAAPAQACYGGCAPGCAGASPLPALPAKPYLPEVVAQTRRCPYALCLDSANYARLLERLRLLEQDDNQLRALLTRRSESLRSQASWDADKPQRR